MKREVATEPLKALTILIPGGVGLFVVGRTLAAYWPRDLIASAIVALIGALLAYGLLELLWRQRRSAELAFELGKLPANPSEATVDGASPLLSALLRARLEQAQAPGLGESIAPYLSGLLVMLGLLGTLLGLFETVHGASQALTTSTDVDALRRGLTRPIDGLTRSFGCSAAGISASAMLGLAAALVRRREAGLLGAIQVYALGPLRALSPLRRQARALEQLVQAPGRSDPAVGLEQVARELTGLPERLVALQQSALAAQGKAMSELLEALRGELGRAAAAAGAALHERIAPLVTEAVARVGELAGGQAAALVEATRAQTHALAEATRQQTASLAHGAQQQTHALAEATQQQTHALAEATQQHTAALANAAQEQARALATLAERQEAVLADATKKQEATLADATRQQTAALAETANALSRELAARAQQQAAALAETSRELGRELSEHARATREGAGELIASLGKRMDEAEQARRAAAQGELAELTALASRTASEAAVRDLALADRWGGLSAHVESAFAALREEEAARLERLDQLTRRAGEELARLAASLSEQAQAQLASEQSHDARAVDVLEQLTRSAALLETSSARQGQAIDTLVERVGAEFSALGAAAREGAEAALARVTASADEQATRLARLEDELARGRAEHARRLEEQLIAHADGLAHNLGDTSQVVQEAAALWRASSVEMQAVADAFAKGVERQREAADAWLGSLGELEGAVERAGRHAAVDALSDQLASTQEVFARQLQFQRELFEQLRALRPAAPRGGHGERDVSV